MTMTSPSRTSLVMKAAALWLAVAACSAYTQAPPTAPSGIAKSQGTSTAQTAQSGDEAAKPSRVLIDQVIAGVNGDLILESDVDEDRRFEAFQPFGVPGGDFSRDADVQRLIDRALILQQAKLQPDQAVTADEVNKQIGTLRKDIPACKAAHCETDAGWNKFVQDHGFTQDQLHQILQQRMQILKFIEMRFRMGIRITPAEIKTNYEKSMLPEYAKQHATPPPLDSISDRIQEFLLQMRVGSLLDDWLQSLKAQGSVRMMKPGEVQP